MLSTLGRLDAAAGDRKGVPNWLSTHPDPLERVVDFPDRWAVSNGPRQVVAKAPDADLSMLLQLVGAPKGADVGTVATTHMQQAGFQAVDGSRTAINGLDSYVGNYQGAVEGLGPVVVGPGESWASLAERSRGAIKASALAVMNHGQPDTPPRLNARIRIVLRD